MFSGAPAGAQVNVPMAGVFQFVNPDVVTLNGVHEDGGVITGSFLFDPNIDQTRVVDFVLDEELGADDGGAELGPTSQLLEINSVTRPMFDGTELVGGFSIFSQPSTNQSIQYTGSFGPGQTGEISIEEHFGTVTPYTLLVNDSGPVDFTVAPIVPAPEPTTTAVCSTAIPLLLRRRRV
jgi:hypothetical protein